MPWRFCDAACWSGWFPLVCGVAETCTRKAKAILSVTEVNPTSHQGSMAAVVESRMGAVAWGQWPALRFPSPLIEPDLRSYRIRLSDWLHREAHDAAASGRRSRRSKPSFS
jgi:hypothetical protein